MMQRTPDFIGCGAVMIVGIKHAQVQGESSRVSYLFIPEGFKDQVVQMDTVSGAEFSGSSWEELVGWFKDHNTSEQYFASGGRAPLMYEAFRYLEASLDICRVAAKQTKGPQTAAWLMQVLVSHTGWIMEPIGHGSRATFTDRGKDPEKFHLAMQVLLGMNPSNTALWSRRIMVSTTPSWYAPHCRCMWPWPWHPFL